MDLNSNLSNFSNKPQQFPIISDGIVKKEFQPDFLEKDSTIEPYKFTELSKKQLDSRSFFSCGNSGIDLFLSHGDGLQFNLDRKKMVSFLMANPEKVVSYLAASFKDVSFAIPDFLSKRLKEVTGFSAGDKVFVIHYLAVDENYQNQGLGFAMVNKALELCRAKASIDPSLKMIILHSTQQSCGFYERLGFEKIGKVENSDLIEYAYALTE